ncbi:FAD-binding protein [Mesorhizobium sp. M8A.F.Ca.ET.208.01.1.1]|nr:FAD-binding protein [Mesorhizobium sp. M8A.F.Ca.ET.208.01.1.1]TGT50665.1 FAD-binding protein [Mesorhizobium sp. M8A.F.Ca.ET.167.01.1.1]
MGFPMSVSKQPLPTAFVQEIAKLLVDRFTTNTALRQQHCGGEGFHAVEAPDAVCFAESEAEVAAILKNANAHRVAVIPFGAGTSLEGHLSAVHGGVSLDVSRMNRILAVHPDDLDVVIEPGVTRQALDRHLKDLGLFFPIDPGAEATIGGMAATRASGTNAVRYGTIRENVLSLRVVLPDGRVIKTGSRARKSSTGYDLTKLFIGSEGTLGIITQLTIRVHGVPEETVAAVCGYPSLKAAVDTVTQIIQLGLPIARAELMDEPAMRACVEYFKLDYEIRPTLFFEFAGASQAIAEQIATVGAISTEMGGGEFRWARDQESRAALWRARHRMHNALLASRPGAKVMPTDACVPISRLTECVVETKADIETAPFFVCLNGHAGDGNFHLGLVIDPDSQEEYEIASGISSRLAYRALAMEGTCSGEHGIGLGKLRYMEAEHGPALDIMRAIKGLFDPNGIMNPGKLIPGLAPRGSRTS